MACTETHVRLNIVAIIPARFASTRLPGKPLSEIQGKPLVQHVYERVCLARRAQRVLVATDDERVATVVRGFGGECVLTSPDHPSGTDRLAEAVRGLDADVVANVQGDEPLLEPGALDATIERLLDDAGLDLATPSAPLRNRDEWESAAVVKVVSDAAGRAAWFSRRPIPAVRDAGDPDAAARRVIDGDLARRHVGLYVFRRQALLRFAALEPTPVERAEGLEQLRALQHGMSIGMARVPVGGGPAVDTPDDLERVRAMLAAPAGVAGRRG